MTRISIVTDSIACLSPEIVRQWGIYVVPLNIHFEGKIYRDGVDMTNAEAYRMLEKSPDQFASSPASAGEYLETFRRAAEGASGILCITLSSHLSTIYNMASVAKEQAARELPGLDIEILDSRTAAIGEGLIVLAAARTAAQGKSLLDVLNAATAVRDKVSVIGIMDTIRHIYRTGRVPELTARVGSMLNIKPVFVITDGIVHVSRLVRSRESGINRALDMIRHRAGNNPVHVAVAHADTFEESERLMKIIGREFNCVELWLADFSPVMAYATGTGVLAIAYYTDTD
jgi:DegV family protein with EDD domain